MKKTRLLLCVCVFLMFVVSLAAEEFTKSIHFEGYVDSRITFNAKGENEFHPYISDMYVCKYAQLAPWLSTYVSMWAGWYEGSDRIVKPYMLEAYILLGWDIGNIRAELDMGLFYVPYALAMHWIGSPHNDFAFDPGITGDFFGSGWNDYGIAARIGGTRLGFEALLVRGDMFEWMEDAVPWGTDNGFAGSGRVWGSPFEGLTVGLTYLVNKRYK